MNKEQKKQIKWEKNVNDLEYFQSLSFNELLTLLDDPDVAMHYAGNVLYEAESVIYRPDPNSPKEKPKGLPVRPETKIMFLIGTRIIRDMKLVKDFAGQLIRTKDGTTSQTPKEKLLESLYKAPEADEVRTVISFYLDGKYGIDLPIVFSEIADIFYNLFHLEITDPENRDQYQKWNQALRKMLGLELTQIIKIIAAKYHYRMFKNGGTNSPKENDFIKSLLGSFYPNANEAHLKQRVSNFLRMADLLFDKVLVDRLKKLCPCYQKSETEKTQIKGAPKKIWNKIKQTMLGESLTEDIFQLKDDEIDALSSMISTVLSLLTKAEQYDAQQSPIPSTHTQET
ncbi:MAG: hypothetical protein A2383_02410 [Candidatus Pacebacteria bacterium RIFOXYB1_FULL_39_46]|nr:MAG: hypothetical protein A2383_02410 [Candidatus Pacebacteria bacterium RIFOXYB1_FULL_39_46]OGJ38603.1 MAG: hypothetical protein A2182_02670 [Candidatus Pacebacteria bacterium RIFOXYA1_FULL_38_18]OGJ40617.1 MAG: hypothetical protein A2582_01930 [Candidatus Pacebacteria bacterium RIFOXYD1_FULL_39_27]OGJ40934.1 MAG: hypothetical protein A2411_00695 [Candidatus Pacebacteria bacterium RIFOXYC1_FULL_39_21]